MLDCFLPHNSEEVKQKFINKNSYLEIIPGGCSSKLNPLTQVISPQFQVKYINSFCHKYDFFEKKLISTAMDKKLLFYRMQLMKIVKSGLMKIVILGK